MRPTRDRTIRPRDSPQGLGSPARTSSPSTLAGPRGLVRLGGGADVPGRDVVRHLACTLDGRTGRDQTPTPNGTRRVVTCRLGEGAWRRRKPGRRWPRPWAAGAAVAPAPSRPAPRWRHAPPRPRSAGSWSTGPRSTVTTQSWHARSRTAQVAQSMIIVSPPLSSLPTLGGPSDSSRGPVVSGQGCRSRACQDRSRRRSRAADGTVQAPAARTPSDTSRSLDTTTTSAAGRLGPDQAPDDRVGGRPGRAEQGPDPPGRAGRRGPVQGSAVEDDRHLRAGLGGEGTEPGEQALPLPVQRQGAVPGLGDVVAVDHEVDLREPEQLVQATRLVLAPMRGPGRPPRRPRLPRGPRRRGRPAGRPPSAVGARARDAAPGHRRRPCRGAAGGAPHPRSCPRGSPASPTRHPPPARRAGP